MLLSASLVDRQKDTVQTSTAQSGRPARPRRRGRWISAVALAPMAGLLLLLGAPPGSAATSKPWFPAKGAYLGASIQSIRDTAAPVCRDRDQAVAVAAFERCIRASVLLIRQFNSWDRDQDGVVWPTPFDAWARDHGHELFLSWRAVTSSGSPRKWFDIAAGRYDADIDTKARALKAFHAPVYLAFHHEPETNKAGTMGTPADFAAAWRHIVTRFRALGVSNVKFVLTLTAWTFDPRSGRHADSYWPGASYVDAVGVDGYNPLGCISPGAGGSNQWRSFGQVFAAPNAWAAAKHVPMMIPEFGSVEDPAAPGRKAAWLRDALVWLKAHRNIKAVSYFQVENFFHGRACRWLVDSSPTSTAAFSAFARDPYLHP